jgi:hypothetical protein
MVSGVHFEGLYVCTSHGSGDVGLGLGAKLKPQLFAAGDEMLAVEAFGVELGDLAADADVGGDLVDGEVGGDL